jgi:hypothetical protein
MAEHRMSHQHYTEDLDRLKTYFPTPVSNPIMDGYFVHTLSRFLDYIDDLKCAAPQLCRIHPMANLNDDNYGPVTLFRVYPAGKGAELYHRGLTDPAFRVQAERYNAYNSRLFQIIHGRAMRGEGVLLSRTDGYRHTVAPDNLPILALKSFIMSPWTDMTAIETIVRQIQEACLQIAAENDIDEAA